MAYGILKCELGDIDTVVITEFRGGTSSSFDLLGLFQPNGKFGIGEESRGKGTSVDGSETFCLEARDEVVCEGGILQRELIVGKDAIDVVFDMIEDSIKAGHWVAGESNGADFSCFLSFDKGGNSFVPNLFKVHEFDIMKKNEIEIVGPHSVHGDVERFIDSFGREIEVIF